MSKEIQSSGKFGQTKNPIFNGSSKEAFFEATDSDILLRLAGAMDENLKVLENGLDLDISRQSKGLTIKGQDAEVDLALDLLMQLSELVAAGEDLFPGDVNRCIKMLSQNRKTKLKELFRDQVKISGRNKSIVPKTFTQKIYLDSIRTHDMIFGIGPAGTGKTYLAMAMAVSELLRKSVKRIILCRPAVESGEKLGFLPGDLAEKVNPYLRPLYDALHDMVEIERADEMIEKGIIEVAPLAFMRGRTLSNAFVILDEAQNTTNEQMKMFLTRIGFGSKCVVTGDITQIDLPRGMPCGLIDAINVLKGVDGISMINFSKEDVIRHPLVARIVDAYDKRKSTD